MNGDESMCFGAAFIASNSSSSFKVRKIYLTQHIGKSYRVEIKPLEPTDATTEGIEYSKEYDLYKSTDFYGQKKSVSLSYDHDMLIKLFDQDKELVSFTIKGIKEIAHGEQNKDKDLGTPKVNLSFELSRSGLVFLTKAELKIEETYTVKVNVTKEAEVKEGEKKEESSEENKDETESKEEVEVETKEEQKKRTNSYPLASIETEYTGPKTLSPEQQKDAKARLKKYDQRDLNKIKLDKAMSDFESFIFELREYLNDDANEIYIDKAEKEEWLVKLVEHEDWIMDGDTSSADHKVFNDKTDEMFKLKKKYLSRQKEH